MGRSALPAAACFALPHLCEERETHLDSWPGPAQRPPLVASSAHPAPWIRPRSACTFGRAGGPAGLSHPGGRGRSELPGRAPRNAGVPGAPALSVWPALYLPDRALLVQLCLDLPVCTSVSLNLELSVSLGLVVSSLWACLDLPFSPSVCLLRVWVPITAVPLTQDAAPPPRL